MFSQSISYPKNNNMRRQQQQPRPALGSSSINQALYFGNNEKLLRLQSWTCLQESKLCGTEWHLILIDMNRVVLLSTRFEPSYGAQ